MLNLQVYFSELKAQQIKACEQILSLGTAFVTHPHDSSWWINGGFLGETCFLKYKFSQTERHLFGVISILFSY